MSSQEPEHSHYQITIAGALDLRWADWFDGMTLTHGAGGSTLLAGRLDQAALYGTLTKLRNLGLTLISVTRVAPDADRQM